MYFIVFMIFICCCVIWSWLISRSNYLKKKRLMKEKTHEKPCREAVAISYGGGGGGQIS